jgi:Tol biopolymer transport system component
MAESSKTRPPVRSGSGSKKITGILGLLAGCLLAAGCGGSGGGVGPSALPTPGPPAARGQILFVSERDGHPQIYVMASDGTGVRRWIASAANDTAPAWSPDYARVAFVSDRNGASHVFVARGDGKQPKDVTPGSAVCGAPAWSPDGTQLVFVQWETTGAQANLRIMRADGSDSRALTTGAGINGGPAWAKSGRIYFTTHRERGGTSFDLYVMDQSGSGQRQVAVIPGLVGRPAVSPGGQWLSYAALVAPETPGLFVTDAGGTGAGRAIGPVNSAEPAWSPDGRHLLFTSWQSGNAKVYSMDTGGGNLKQLTADAAADGGASW